MTDLETWFLDFGSDHIFRLYDPFSICVVEKVRINNMIELPNKDVLIEYSVVNSEEDFNAEWGKAPLCYKKLSEIKLEYHPYDNQFCSNATALPATE
ncbi:hypothetical protein GPK90_05410 [Clostridium sp. MCC344]|nr:hypothetical protein [Clostridium sp. MCC344]MBT9788783.1 hypothetical protein [Clostridium sp. MCC344]